LPGLSRPGDRSRRDDDRQLMLEALLSARRVLSISWSGRSARDNSELPPSVLVSQLRDYLAAGWSGDVLGPRTTEHPLQPFSRRYFAAGSALHTHAREWRAAHVAPQGADDLPDADGFLPGEDGIGTAPSWTLARLAAFLKNPVKDFFRHRLQVVFDAGDAAALDDEAFGLDGLETHGIVRELVEAVDVRGDVDPAPWVAAHLRRLQRAGRFPLAELGARQRDALGEAVLPMLRTWHALHLGPSPGPAEARRLRFEHAGLVVDDTLWLWPPAAPGQPPAWREIVPSRLCDPGARRGLRPDVLLTAWVRSLVAAACGVEAAGVLVGRDARAEVPLMPSAQALPLLRSLLDACAEAGVSTDPPPVACLTAVAWTTGGAEAAEKAYEGDGSRGAGEAREACLARVHPDFESLAADGRFERLALQLYAPLRPWLDEQLRVVPHDAPPAGDGKGADVD